MADHIDDLLLRIGECGTPPEDLRDLVVTALDLGATDEEVVAAGRSLGLVALALDLTLRPPGETLAIDTFATDSGLDPEFARRMWLAFGLPDTGEAPVPVTPDVADALRVMAFLAANLGEDDALGLARVIGSASAGLADALVNTVRLGVEQAQLDTGARYTDVASDLRGLARDLLPVFWDAVGAVFRRHLVLVAHQAWAPDEARAAVTLIRTVGFVDLVGSTEALRSLSVAELARSVNEFEQLVWDVVSRAGGRVVKLIGDEAMFVVADPRAACAAADAIVDASSQPVRVGLAHGEIVAFHGDCYGPTVNLAARLVAAAGAGTILVSPSMQKAMGDVETLVFEAVDPGPLRGFPEVELAYRVTGGGLRPDG